MSGASVTWILKERIQTHSEGTIAMDLESNKELKSGI